MTKLFTFFLLLFVSTSVFSLDYYWVGGTGNWSDFANHWATTSGGATFHAQVPTLNDNVYFDANSFTSAGQTVTNDQTIIYCRDMDWSATTNNPTFAGPSSNDLKIYGSLIFSNNMTISYAGEIYFEATSIGKTITMAGQSFGAYIYFNGIGGGWEFTDAFQSSTWVHLVHGTVTTNDNQVTVGAMYASANNPMTLNLGASLVTITGSTWAWWVNNSSFTLNAGTSLLRLTSASSPDIRYANNLNFYDVEFTDPNTTAEIISSNNSSFNSVTFMGNGKINGSHSYNNLNFSAGKLYELASGATQTVTTLNANGTCTEYITIKSSSVGAQTTIAKASGAVSIDFVQLQDIAASGGATFTANNAVDLGNNTGWTINTSAARNLYWVGDAGDWTDASHWSISSGGTGGNCPPTFQDNVYFDANSFTTGGQTVTIDANASCNDMDWTGVSNNPTFAGANANNLSIYGSLTFAAAMNRTYAGLTYFEATSIGKTITMAGQSFSAYAYFNGIGGGWEFTDAFQSSTWVHLVHGTVTTNDNQVTVGAFYASSNNPMTLNLGASLVTITGSTWAWWVNNSSFVLNAGTSMVRLTSPSSPDIRNANNLSFYDVEFTDPNTTAEIISSNNSSFNSVTFTGNGKINGSHSYNTITFSPGRTYTLQANSTQSIINSFNARGTGGFPIEFLSTSPGVQANFSMANGVVCTEYLFLRDNNATGGATWRAENSTDNGNVSGWIFGPCSLLPIDLISFEGAAEVGKNQLLWTTSSEEQSDYFVLEKSADGYSWSVLEEIQTVGNSAALQYYSYADAQPFEITYYRLRLVDNDLTAAYSDVIVLHNVSVVGQSGIKIYPNPAKSNLYINSPQKIENVEIRILNNIGQKVWTRRLYLEGTQQLDLSQLEAGVHTILILKKETIMVEKFVRIE